jgi:hypothetical protein
MNLQTVLQRLGGEVAIDERDLLRQQLAVYVNELILHDFDQLVQVLYRVDVEEKKLKSLLKDHPGSDAATLITDLILQRLEAKRQSRQSFSSSKNDIPNEERW